MRLQDLDFRVWNPNIKIFGFLEGEISLKGKIDGESVAIIPIDIKDLEFELYTMFRDSKSLEKVFVNDVIKYSWSNQEKIGRVVDWDFNASGFNVNSRGEFLPLGAVEILEVLGNIHENPELLGGEE